MNEIHLKKVDVIGAKKKAMQLFKTKRFWKMNLFWVHRPSSPWLLEQVLKSVGFFSKFT